MNPIRPAAILILLAVSRPAIASEDFPAEWGPLVAYRAKGSVWGGVHVQGAPNRWFAWEGFAGGSIGLDEDVNIDDGGTGLRVGSLESDVFPHVATGGFLHLPWRYWNAFGIGLGVQGFHHVSRYEDKDFPANGIEGRLSGWNYNFYIPLLRLSLSKRLKTGGTLTLGLNYSFEFGGKDYDLVATGPGGSGYVLTNGHVSGGIPNGFTLAYYFSPK